MTFSNSILCQCYWEVRVRLCVLLSYGGLERVENNTFAFLYADSDRKSRVYAKGSKFMRLYKLLLARIFWSEPQKSIALTRFCQNSLYNRYWFQIAEIRFILCWLQISECMITDQLAGHSGLSQCINSCWIDFSRTDVSNKSIVFYSFQSPVPTTVLQIIR